MFDMFDKALFKLSVMVLSPFFFLAKSQVMTFLTIFPYICFFLAISNITIRPYVV